MQRRASKNKKYGGGGRRGSQKRRKKRGNKIGPEDDMDILQKQYFKQVDDADTANQQEHSINVNNMDSIDAMNPNAQQAAGPVDPQN